MMKPRRPDELAVPTSLAKSNSAYRRGGPPQRRARGLLARRGSGSRLRSPRAPSRVLRLHHHVDPAAPASGAAPAQSDQARPGGAQPSPQPHGFDAGGVAARCILGIRRQPSGGLSHAKSGRNARRCHSGGDGARHRRYRDRVSAQPHGVGQGAANGRTRWRPCAPRFPPPALALRRCGYRNGRLTW